MQKYGGRVAEVWGKGCRSLGEGLQKSGGSVIILETGRRADRVWGPASREHECSDCLR